MQANSISAWVFNDTHGQRAIPLINFSKQILQHTRYLRYLHGKFSGSFSLILQGRERALPKWVRGISIWSTPPRYTMSQESRRQYVYVRIRSGEAQR